MNEKGIQEAIEYWSDMGMTKIEARNMNVLLSCAAVCLEVLGMESKAEKGYISTDPRWHKDQGYNECLREIQQLIKKER